LSKLSNTFKVPREYVFSVWSEIVRNLDQQVNRLSEGRIDARHTASTAAPTTGTYAQGDIVWNSSPSELGSGGSKYVILGWLNVTAGSPGTFVQLRCLTGN
jgi:hypothetical protein